MSNWNILTIKHRREWNDLVNSCKQPDVHFTAEYMQLFEEHIVGESFLFVEYNSDKSNYVLYPFFKRKINDLKIFSDYGKVIFDIISPWYFGGPLLYHNANSVELLDLFLRDFGKYVKENNIITEFTRIHPLLFSSNDFINLSKAQYKYDISYIDLNVSHETIWKNFKKSNRNAINGAKRKGVEIKTSNSISAMKIFYDLYIKSMNRLNADKSYFLAFSFFQKLLESFSNNMIIFTATYEGIPISSSIFLFKSGIIHYWLSGSDFDRANLYSNNLLLAEAILWAKNRDNKIFILGGGSNKGLRTFKESFTNTKAGFYTIHKVYDHEVFSYLTEIRRSVNNTLNNTDFFPPYRA